MWRARNEKHYVSLYRCVPLPYACTSPNSRRHLTFLPMGDVIDVIVWVTLTKGGWVAGGGGGGLGGSHGDIKTPR